MRTTLTLDEDVAARLKAEARRSGRPFKAVVNDHLRLALSMRKELRRAPPFKVRPRNLGGPRGQGYDNVAELLETLEGPAHR